MQDIVFNDNNKKQKDDKSDNSKSTSNSLNDNKKNSNNNQNSNSSLNNNSNTQYAPQPIQQPSNNWGSWDDSFNSWGNDSFSNNNQNNQNNQNKRMTPEERVQMIEKVYEEVLKRKPDTKDINYYKYSTLNEDEIKKQLLNGKEHTDLIQDGREFSKMKERTENAEVRVKVLEGQIRDQVEEFKKLGELLREKNKFIIELREKLNNRYNLPD